VSPVYEFEDLLLVDFNSFTMELDDPLNIDCVIVGLKLLQRGEEEVVGIIFQCRQYIVEILKIFLIHEMEKQLLQVIGPAFSL